MYQPHRCSFLSRPPPLAAGAEQGGWALWEARSPWPRETWGVCGGKGLELSLDLILQVRPGTKCASAQVVLGRRGRGLAARIRMGRSGQGSERPSVRRGSRHIHRDGPGPWPT